jgi:hypothetical protein
MKGVIAKQSSKLVATQIRLREKNTYLYSFCFENRNEANNLLRSCNN